MKRLIILICFGATLWAQLPYPTIANSDGATFRSRINSNFSYLDTNKAKTGACASGEFAVQTTSSGVVCLAVDWSVVTGIPSTFTPAAHASSHQQGGSDEITPVAIGAEPALGNPASDGYILKSTAAGVRSWEALGAGHTQNTDTGTTATCFQLDNDNTGPKVCNDGAGGFQVKTSADAVMATISTAGVMTLGDGTAKWELEGITQDSLPSASGTANTFRLSLARTGDLLTWITNGGSRKYVGLGTSAGIPIGDDTAYNATTWNGSTNAPTQNAVRDQIETLAPKADPVFTGSAQIPNGTGPTVDAAGEIAVDTTSDQLQFYGGAKRALPSIQHVSFVIPAPAATDDMLLMKAPYGMSIINIKGVLQGSTNVVGQLQECNSSGASCADLDSDITFDGGEDGDDGSLTDSSIASGNWIAWKTTSVSGTPTFLTVTVTFRVVAD